MMSEKIDVKKVAKLARLELTEQEEAYYTEKFEQILGYVSLLNEVEIDGELEGKDESDQVIYRTDKTTPSDVQPEDFSENTENKFFKVPSVME